MNEFSVNIAMSINDFKTLSVDVIYFDFAKVFDSVNHDLILQKLKFLVNYLCDCEQCFVIELSKSSLKQVLSGVP